MKNIIKVLTDANAELQKEVSYLDKPFAGMIYNCDTCKDTGSVTVDVFDPDSGQMMRGVGTVPCVHEDNRIRDEDTYERDEDGRSEKHYNDAKNGLI